MISYKIRAGVSLWFRLLLGKTLLFFFFLAGVCKGVCVWGCVGCVGGCLEKKLKLACVYLY